MKTSKARIANVFIGHIILEGIMLPNGSFGLTIQQAATVFSVPPKNAQRQFKSILGKGSQFLTSKITREGQNENNRDQRYMTIEQFELLLTRMSFKGNKIAQALVEDLVGLSLTQLWSDAFNIKFEKEQRAEYLESRQEHRLEFHTRLTPFWKEDGCIGKQYQERVIEFKRVSCLPEFKSVDKYNATELKILNTQEIKYQTLREVGLSYEDAIRHITI